MKVTLLMPRHHERAKLKILLSPTIIFTKAVIIVITSICLGVLSEETILDTLLID